jgi:GDSL-like Lipase/Acylhydrolase family
MQLTAGRSRVERSPRTLSSRSMPFARFSKITRSSCGPTNHRLAISPYRCSRALSRRARVNDLNASGIGALPGVICGLRTMICTAQAQHVIVFLATLLPERKGGSHAGDPTLIPPANDQIRALATSEGAKLVDVCAAFYGSPDPFIDADGLHPTLAGYQKIAATFFDAIRAQLNFRRRF